MGADWLDAGANVFSAIGTVGAFAVALVLFRREHAREAAHSEDARRAQAVRVSAWIEQRRTAHGAPELAFHVHNASDMPIYEVSLPDPADEALGDDTPEEDGGPGEAEFIGLVPPGRTVTRPAPQSWRAAYRDPEPVPLEFVDSSGQRWTRDEDGTLTRTASETRRPSATG